MQHRKRRCAAIVPRPCRERNRSEEDAMRLPFLQVDADALTRARVLAKLLGTDRHRAVSMMVDLWTWALESDGDGKPSGVIYNPSAAVQLAGAVEWDRDADAMISALVSARLVEHVPEGLRVRGMDRYHAAWDRQEADKARKAEARAKLSEKRSPQEVRRKSAGHPQDVRGTSAGHPQDGANIPADVRSIDVDVDVDVKKLETTSPYARTRAEGSPLRDRLSEVFSELRGASYSFSFECEQAGKRVMQLAQGDDDEILRRWRNALSRTRYPQCDGMKDLVRHWNAYATEQREPPAVQFAGKPTRAPRVGDERAATTGQPCVSCGKAEGVRDSYGTWMCGPCADHSDAYWQKPGGAA